MNTFIAIFIFITWILLGIFSSVYMFKMVNILNAEGIPTSSLEFIFSYSKFRKFIETFNGDEKNKYIKIYRRAIWLRRIPILLFIFLIVLIYILAALA